MINNPTDNKKTLKIEDTEFVINEVEDLEINL